MDRRLHLQRHEDPDPRAKLAVLAIFDPTQRRHANPRGLSKCLLRVAPLFADAGESLAKLGENGGAGRAPVAAAYPGFFDDEVEKGA